MSANMVSTEVQLSEAQGKALREFDSWYYAASKVYTGKRRRDPEAEISQATAPVSQIFRLFGYAGSGKTTLAAAKARSLGGGVMAATFTGKAALVMRKKGFSCSTIHSLIYCPEMVPVLDKAGNPTGEEKLQFVLNDESDLWYAKLLVVDEVSMVNEELALDLLSFNVPILVLGDPGQLPPVSGSGYFMKGTPDVMLTEIHRQALDSPIIRMSMDVRLGRGLKLGNYGESKVISRTAFSLQRQELLTTAQQVLCGINRTRRTLNFDMRRYLGFEMIAAPMKGDKLICLRNNKVKRLFNGGMWQLMGPPQFDGECYEMELLSLDMAGHTAKVEVPLEFFIGEEDKLPGAKRRKYDEFDFGYGITVHKAQGSQWDNMLLVNENYCFRESAVQHLYTGITRAAETLTVVV